MGGGERIMKTIIFKGKEEPITNEAYEDLLGIAEKNMTDKDKSDVKVCWALDHLGILQNGKWVDEKDIV